MFRYYLYKLAQFLVNGLSLNQAYRMAIILSDLHYYLSFRDRKAVRDNLRHILTDTAKISWYTRGVFRNFGRYLVEFFRMEKHIDKKFIEKYIKIQNQEYIDQVQHSNTGGIILTAHIGNWELGAATLALLGYSLSAVVLPHKQRTVNDLFNHQREIKGIKVIPTHQAIRRCLKELKNKRFIALVADRDFSYSGIEFEFFGQKTRLPKGPVLFALKTNVPIIPTFLISDGNGKFTLKFYKPIELPKNRNGLSDDRMMKKIMKEYVNIIENEVSQNPSQWLMFKKFWIDN